MSITRDDDTRAEPLPETIPNEKSTLDHPVNRPPTPTGNRQLD
eukprot:COSAG06_NODE_75851_length_127_cov_39.250000_1_plen_42_part_11